MHLTIDPRSLSTVDADGKRSIQAGEYTVFVGGAQPGEGVGITAKFRIEGTKELPRLGDESDASKGPPEFSPGGLCFCYLSALTAHYVL